jgi:phosphate transport system substrate-binding protein
MDVMTFGWMQFFRHCSPKVQLTIEARGLFTAAPALIAGSADLAPTSLTFTPRELAAFERKYGYPPLLLRVSGGSFDRIEDGSKALAIYVNRLNPIARLTLAQLDAIFSTTRKRGSPGDLATWGQLGLTGEWADRPITVYGSRLPNSLASAFQDLVLLHGEFKPSIREQGRGADDDSLAAVVAAVARDSNAIGFAGFAQDQPAVKALAIGETDRGPFISGSFESVLRRTYPLARFGYIYVNRPPGRPLPAAVREFLRLVLSREGQRIVTEDGVSQPLPAAIIREELAKLE